MNRPVIGCIADDFTGATDLAGLLRRSGMRVVQSFGIPADQLVVNGMDAVVIALKTRSIAANIAIEQSCDAAKWLESIGVSRFFFKYCSTFDSTPQGNIGPVAEALMGLLGVEQTIFCPAFPENGRTVLSGSCSLATQQQVQRFRQHHRSLYLDLTEEIDASELLSQAKQWVSEHILEAPLLICTTTDAKTLEKVRQRLGRQRAAELAEWLLSELAAHLLGLGIKRLVVAGGETSGSVTQRLGIEAIRIGPEIAPGVPWTESLGHPRIALALKSGNFGSPDFFDQALDLLP